jgi:hypothetical protein
MQGFGLAVVNPFFKLESFQVASYGRMPIDTEAFASLQKTMRLVFV